MHYGSSPIRIYPTLNLKNGSFLKRSAPTPPWRKFAMSGGGVKFTLDIKRGRRRGNEDTAKG